MNGGLRAKPVNAFVLSLLGSLFIILGAILSVILFSGGFYISSSLASAFTAVSGALGVVMLFASIMMYTRPDLHVAWGVAILVLSVASFTSVFSGFAGLGLGLVGMVLGIVGGALGVGWNPARIGPMGSVGPFRVCLACGRPYPPLVSFCPYCGAAAPPVTPWTPPQQPPGTRP